eukprot:12814435-Alexandrium_andersonii.AAC.1
MVVNVPLDTVDLRAFADIFNVQIVVTRMLDVALRFSPPGLGRPSGRKGAHKQQCQAGPWAPV